MLNTIMSKQTTRAQKRKAKEKNKNEPAEPQTDDSTIREMILPVHIVFLSEDEEDSSAKEDNNPTLDNGVDLPSNNEKHPTGRRKYRKVENNTVSEKQEEQGRPINRPKNMAATYSCSECSYTTDNSYNLKIHKMTHSDVRPYRCPTCKFGFRLKSHLTRHCHSTNCSPSNKKCKDSPPLLKCSSCTYTTLLAYNLKIHQRIHTDDRPYECRTCVYKFRTQSHLLRHTRRGTCQPVIKTESTLAQVIKSESDSE